MSLHRAFNLCFSAVLLAPVSCAGIESAAHAEALAADGACSEGGEACGVELLQQAARRGDKTARSGPQRSGTCTDGCGESVKAYNYERPYAWALDGNPICFTGPRQSPIDICQVSTVRKSDFVFVPTYQPVSDAAVTNTGHNLEVVGDFGTTRTNDGQVWRAEQFHIHSPSEHKVNGVAFPLELHLVHTTTTGVTFTPHNIDVSLLSESADLNATGRAEASSSDGMEHGSNYTKRAGQFEATVVGIIFELGFTTSPCVSAMLNPTVPKDGCQRCLPDPVDLASCFARELSGPYYYYSGSFTTPPCTEKTQWHVMERRATITAFDFAKLKKLGFPEPSNARPVQPVNGRVVYRA